MGNQTNATAQQAIAEQNSVELVEGVEKKFSLEVIRVQVFDNDEVVNVQLQLNKTIPGFTKTEDGDFVNADVNAISFSRSALTRQLCEADDGIAMLRDGQKTPLTRQQLAVLLRGAAITVVRTYHAAGFVPDGRDPLPRAQWFSEIESIKLTDFATNLIQKVVMERMMAE